MILDLERFVDGARPRWQELERLLDRLEADPLGRGRLPELVRLHALYRRAAADLARVATFSSEPEMRRYLEALVSRAYGEIHETRRAVRVAPWRFLTRAFPRAFRRHAGAFALAAALTAAGTAFGGLAVALDPQAKAALMPFPQLLDHPSARVEAEEAAPVDRLQGARATFSATLSTHNTRVAIFCFALGITWGIGTAIVLFFNGALLGAVAFDYVQAGHAGFLFGWLLPHGAVEIPALLIAGQSGLVLAGALLGWGDRTPLPARLRAVGADLGALLAGLATLLVWAGLVESFLSQYHEPFLPYGLKIGFGIVEGVLLGSFLLLAGRRTT